MLKNLFSLKDEEPILRFPEFKNKYKSLRLKDMLSYSSSKLSINRLENNTGNYKLYGAEGIVKYIDFYDMDEEYISIIKDGAGVSKLHYCEPKTSIVGTMGYLTLKDNNLNLKYIYYLLSNLNLKKYVVGSTIPHIYFKEYSKEKIKIPSFKEQEEVVRIVSKIDTKIKLITKQIKCIKQFKKSLLQKMFI